MENQKKDQPARRGLIVGISALTVLLAGVALIGTYESAGQNDGSDSAQGNSDRKVDDRNNETDQPQAPSIAIIETTKKLGFLLPSARDDFRHCVELAALNPAVSAQTICDSQPLNDCAFAIDRTCTVEAVLVDNRLQHIALNYTYADLDEQGLLDTLHRLYGEASIDEKSDDILDMKSQSYRWLDGQISISLMHLTGTNFEGEPYDNASLMFADTALPDPMSEQ